MLPVSAVSSLATAAVILLFHEQELFYAGESGAGFILALILCALAAGGLCCALTAILAGRIVRPLSGQQMDFTELSPLLDRIEDQRSLLKVSGSMLQEKEGNLRTIMEHMSEGLALLDARGVIMAMNPSAAALLDAGEESMTGKHIFAVNPHPTLQGAVHAALGGIASSELLELGGRALEITVNPVSVDGAVKGAVLLVMDVTEQQAAEQMRREFSANVSHELKTPLTSISGYAELIREGLARPEDVQRFSGKIYDEAQRLLALIEDIIRLSRLDEGGTELELTETDLAERAAAAVRRLADKAARYGVNLIVSGESAPARANVPLLDEMIDNLCDNAVKYNRPGGSVELITGVEEGKAVLTVKDTGIGIPPEHQAHVFERFYRVDKSHSKETGGTGLGLSIVKHGAAFHRAELELHSVPDRGTVLRLRFPPAEG